MPAWPAPHPPVWPIPGAVAPMDPGWQADNEVRRARGHTRTGLLLLTVGVALGWIPVVRDLGGLLALIGIIFLFVGRWGFSPRHHDLVVVGGVLLVIGFVASIVIAVALVGAIIQAASQIGATPQTLGSALESSIEDTIIAALVVSIVSGIGQILMVWAIADGTSQKLLLIGFAAGIIIAVAIVAIELPLLSSAIQSATSGSSIDLGPINNFQNQTQIFELLTIVPSAITAYAYYRIWNGIQVEPEVPVVPTPRF
jgi:hypothetical protein